MDEATETITNNTRRISILEDNQEQFSNFYRGNRMLGLSPLADRLRLIELQIRALIVAVGMLCVVNISFLMWLITTTS